MTEWCIINSLGVMGVSQSVVVSYLNGELVLYTMLKQRNLPMNIP